MIEAKKISFQEAWDSSIVFFVDEELEQEIESEVESLIKIAGEYNSTEFSLKNMINFLAQKKNTLDVILKDLALIPGNNQHRANH